MVQESAAGRSPAGRVVARMRGSRIESAFELIPICRRRIPWLSASCWLLAVDPFRPACTRERSRRPSRGFAIARRRSLARHAFSPEEMQGSNINHAAMTDNPTTRKYRNGCLVRLRLTGATGAARSDRRRSASQSAGPRAPWWSGIHARAYESGLISSVVRLISRHGANNSSLRSSMVVR